MTKEEQQELNFGILFPGAAIIKTIKLSCGNSPPACLNMKVKREFTLRTELGRKDFMLEPAQVNVTLTIPQGTEQGRYSGIATVTQQVMAIALCIYSRGGRT